MEETLEELRLVHATKDARLLGLGETGLVVGRLRVRLQPFACIMILHVHVFDADMAAVRLLQRGDDIAEFLLTAAFEIREGKGLVEVGFLESEVIEGKFRMSGRRFAQRIEMRLKMAE